MTDAAGAVRPRGLDVAVGLCLVAAAVAVVFAALVPFQIGPAIDQERQTAGVTRAQLTQLQQALTTVSVVAIALVVVWAALLVVFALRLRAGRRRARIGVVVLTALALLPLNAQALLVVVLLVVADVLLFRRPVATWLRA